MSYYCYMIYTDNNKTYIGATINIEHRIRQHNKEISGGAKATSIQVSQGYTWKYACYITNIPEWRTALQIEWKWKQLGRTEYKHISDPIHRRLHSLKKLLLLEKPTSKSIPYDSYPTGPLKIIWNSSEFERYYYNIQEDE